ncbi:MAG: monophosphatase [Rikenellaceae bacterium]|nr:monophosphatase [Rikenellaceae bacterium]MDI3544825.1 monophosphatase [Rikenellaceae bacterium]MDN5355477.1 monophosphatase [Rikenellaceae bacterium]
MKNESLVEILMPKVIELVEEVGDFIVNERRNFDLNRVEEKSPRNLVSYVDKTAEEKLIDGLSILLPNSNFLSEEFHSLEILEELSWIIDPLDGTTNFVHNFPLYTISIALAVEQELMLGVVYDPLHKEMFHATGNHGAYLNDRQIHVSKTSTFNDSLWATGFPYQDFGKLKEYVDFFYHLIKVSHGVRRLGSAAADLAWTACGRVDGFYEYGLSPWDVAGGAIIVKEAGGKITNFTGGDEVLFSKEIIASNSLIHDEFLDNFEKIYFSI